MSGALLSDAFAHHTWSAVRLIDAYRELTDEQLNTPVPGTYGSAIDTLRHVVESDADYLNILLGMPEPWFDLSQASLSDLQTMTELCAEGWSSFLGTNPNPDAMVREVDPDDGYIRDAPIAIRLAEALYHANEHRTQILAILYTLGVPAPRISVWDYGAAEGRLTEVYPPEE